MSEQETVQQPTPEELLRLKPISSPALYASNFRVQGTGNDFTLVLQRVFPAQTEAGEIFEGVGRLEIVATVTLSPQSAKDLHVLLASQVALHEREFGTIETPYTKQLQSQIDG